MHNSDSASWALYTCAARLLQTSQHLQVSATQVLAAGPWGVLERPGASLTA